MNEKVDIEAVVILSGGLDSTTLLYQIVDKVTFGDRVLALSVDYGQRHKKEIGYAIQTCKKLGVKHHRLSLTALTEFLKGSALTDDSVEMPLGHYEHDSMKLTYVPNRNMILLSIATGICVANNCKKLYYGAHSGDHAIYPDCRQEFLDAMNAVTAIANYSPVEIMTPYMRMTKGDIVRKGIALGVDYASTWTCYQGREKACGKCGSCQERLEAFHINGISDPLQYE